MHKIPIEVSARHAHLTQSIFEQLFGNNIRLIKMKDLSQPGEFASEQTVTLVGPKGALEYVRILGPFRQYNQIEVSKTDANRLGIDPPIRDSDELDLAGTPGITIVGPMGEVTLEKGVVIPWRHIHLNPNEALELGLENGQIVSVDTSDNPRSLVFENVLVRISPKYKLAMHIDTDEANAGGITTVGEGILITNN